MALEFVTHNKAKTAGIAAVTLIALVAIGAASLHVSPLSWGWYQPYDTTSDVALGGYDPVAYHTLGAATAGSKSLSCQWAGVNWQFAAAEHKELFLADPERYAPQYGGHCAKAVSAGYTAGTDPTVWHIDNDRLYLFVNGDVKLEWIDGAGGGLLASAEANWSSR